MSVQLNERYPGRFDNPSSQYPQGAFKNRSAPGVLDGSYLEKDWANDKEGLFQSLLVGAGMTPNGRVDTVGDSQYFDALLQLIAANSPTFPGQIIWISGENAPAGTLKANRAAVSRTTYANLFSAIGTRYGAGNGTTTFNLPDMRGEFPRGWDDGRGIDVGRLLGSAQLDAFQGHRMESIRYLSGAIGNDTDGAGVNSNGQSNGSSSVATRPRNLTGAFVTDGVNGAPRTASETRGRNIALLACIVY